MIELLTPIASQIHSQKVKLGVASGASESLLHVHAGLLIFVLVALLLRRKMRSPIPIACVAVFALGNEAVDWLASRAARPVEPYIDVLNSIFWPLVLFLLARRWR